MFNSFSAKVRMVKEPQLTETGSMKICRSTVVNSQKRKDKNEWVEHALFFNVSAFGSLADKLNTIKKGEEFIVCGSLMNRTYKKKDGTDGSSLELTNVYSIEVERKKAEAKSADDDLNFDDDLPA